MDSILISAEDQLDIMNMIACGSGSRCYEHVLSDMYDCFRKKYGRYVTFDMEDIDPYELQAFIDWVESEDEDD